MKNKNQKELEEWNKRKRPRLRGASELPYAGCHCKLILSSFIFSVNSGKFALHKAK